MFHSLLAQYSEQPVRFSVELLKEFDRAFISNEIDYIISLLRELITINLDADALVGLLANIKFQCQDVNGLCLETYMVAVQHAINTISVANWSIEDIEDTKRLLM